MTVLSIRDLNIRFRTGDGMVHAVNDLSFDIPAGTTLGIVGESGSGKSQIALAAMGLLASNAEASGEVLFEGQNLLTAPQRALNRVRARQIAMIFQDPMSALNPYMTVERQLCEIVEHHEGASRRDARRRALEVMDAVQIPDAPRRIRAYPHELSGGMRQRIVIAMALMCQPQLILADEPTTALDVTVQAQIMRLLKEIKRDFGTTIVLITHDFGVVAGFCHETIVLYGGRIMERASTTALFDAPSHPYTRGLLRSVPNPHATSSRLATIPGNPPNQRKPASQCPFAPRCGDAIDDCFATVPVLREGRACLRPVEALK